MKTVDGLKVGDTMNYGIGGDCYPYEITEVLTEKRIKVRSMKHVLAPDSPPWPNTKYLYFPSEEGEGTILTKRRDGRWIPKGCQWNGSMRSTSYRKGAPRYYQDPSF
jgi:hypothetical protein